MTRASNSPDFSTPIPQIRLYRDWLSATHRNEFSTYEALRRWSVEDLNGFWRSIWDFDGIVSPTPFAAVLNEDRMPGARWFDGAQVNYARQVFRHVTAADQAGQPAIVAMDERGGRLTLG